ncbi:MAG: hypothetical protein R3E76_12465 [Planctomycetota bacterium]
MSKHTDFARRTFGLQQTEVQASVPCTLPTPGTGECVAVIGPSGAGKTLALRNLNARELTPLRCEELDTPVLELFDPRLPSDVVLRALARVGLADGRLWGLKARHLSAGECRRLEFALALCGHSGLLVADEFDAHLDAATACVLSENLRRWVKRNDLRLVVSTHRPETLRYLQPEKVIEIDRGVAHERSDLPGNERRILDEIKIVRGRLKDYAAFAQWHYLGPGRPGPTSDVYLAMHLGRAVGVVVLGYPHLLLAARNSVLPQFGPKRVAADGAARMNQDLRLLQRVVVEPRFRGVGVARALIRHALQRTTASYVECIAQMGDFSDFLLGSGFRRVGEIPPPASAKGVSEFLSEKGIAPTALLTPETRAGVMRELSARDRQRLESLLSRLLSTRIQTGFGSLRARAPAAHEALLQKALGRISASPGYFLWSREMR